MGRRLCGRKLKGTLPMAKLTVYIVQMSYPCPQCSSKYTQRVQLMYSDNTRRSTGFRGERSLSQTDLAVRHAPPKRRSTLGRKILVVLLFGIVLVGVIQLRGNPPNLAKQSPMLAQVQQMPTLRSPDRKHRAKQILAPRQQPINPPHVESQSETQAPKTNRSEGTLLTISLYSLVIVFLIWSIRRTNRYNTTVWEPAIQFWNASFLCKACGHVFLPGQ
jgi:hypothetical protein